MVSMQCQSFEKIMNLNDEEDEDTIHINVTKDMSREDVVQTILKLVREREEKQKKNRYSITKFPLMVDA